MPESTSHAVQDVFCEVLESLAFLFGDPVAREELPPVDGPLIEASIGYLGPTRGRLTLLAPQSLASVLAANVLGVDEDDASAVEQGRDALGEIMNVTIGRLLTTMAGSAPVFDLTPPSVSDSTTQRWQELIAAEDCVAIMIEDKPVLLKLTAETAAITTAAAPIESEP